MENYLYRALSNCPSVDMVGGAKWEKFLNDRRDVSSLQGDKMVSKFTLT